MEHWIKQLKTRSGELLRGESLKENHFHTADLGIAQACLGYSWG